MGSIAFIPCCKIVLMFYNDSRIRRVWCIGAESTMVAKRKALDAPHSAYALLGNVGLRGMISARCASCYGGAYPRIVGAN